MGSCNSPNIFPSCGGKQLYMPSRVLPTPPPARLTITSGVPDRGRGSAWALVHLLGAAPPVRKALMARRDPTLLAIPPAPAPPTRPASLAPTCLTSSFSPGRTNVGGVRSITSNMSSDLDHAPCGSSLIIFQISLIIFVFEYTGKKQTTSNLL